MSNHPSALTDHLGYWLRLVSNDVSFGFARRVEALGVTVAEWVFLRELYGVDTAMPARLSERMGMTRGAISKLAERLLAKGLIERCDNPDDGRGQILALSKAGRELVPRLAKLADANDDAFFADLPAQDRADLDRILRSLAQRHGLKDVPIS
jgi:DNA-binding MarR family transcriptional regulator